MSNTRRDFLKTLTVGGIALFTADWFAAVQARQPAQPNFRLPANAKDPIPKGHEVINAVWDDYTGYLLYLNGTPYDEPPKITLREKLIAVGEKEAFEVVEEFHGKYGAYVYDLDALDGEVEADDVIELNKEGGSYTFEAGETWRDFIERHDWQLLEAVEISAGKWGRGILDRLDDNFDWDEHEGWLTDWCRNNAPTARALGYVEELFDQLEKAGEERPELQGQLEAFDLDGIYFIDGACPGSDTLRCAVAPDYLALAALQRAIDGLGRSATVVLLEPAPGDAPKQA